jgi:peroxiredoxin (alkyl hydroperoxide reductase subunit C)
MKRLVQLNLLLLLLFFYGPQAIAAPKPFTEYIYNPGTLTPIASELKVSVGQEAPDFTLPSITGTEVTLSQFRDKHNVVLSFVPAAWTPVCSDQWPGYNIARSFFDTHDAILLGITVDNIPTLYAWTRQMGELWFDVLSDFFPHGQVADSYGVLRTDGTAERALMFINKKGILTGIYVSDINVRPSLETVVAELTKMSGK